MWSTEEVNVSQTVSCVCLCVFVFEFHKDKNLKQQKRMYTKNKARKLTYKRSSDLTDSNLSQDE